jgi:hypothetical protein
MLRKLMFIMCVALAGCATITVHKLNNPDFSKYHIPRTIVIAPVNDSAQTAERVAEFAGGFAGANFSVVNTSLLEGQLSARSLSLKSLINNGDYAMLRTVTGIDGVLFVREFYGTELHFVETAGGTEIASGCWRTGYITIINDVVDQIRKRKPSPRLCPVKIE